MYVIQVQNLEGNKTEYYRARSKTEAELFQMSSINFVHIFTAHEFLSRLPLVPLVPKAKDDFDVIL